MASRAGDLSNIFCYEPRKPNQRAGMTEKKKGASSMGWIGNAVQSLWCFVGPERGEMFITLTSDSNNEWSSEAAF